MAKPKDLSKVTTPMVAEGSVPSPQTVRKARTTAVRKKRLTPKSPKSLAV